MLTILGIIPARYHSTRFPGKPLAMIYGKSMIQRVYEQALKSKSLKKVIVATDDERILKHVKGFGGNVLLTSANHQNGTERCAEVLSLVKEKYDGVINIQGDEPFIQPQQIELVASCLKKGAEIATLMKGIDNLEEYYSLSAVKVIVNKKSEAIYFSRSPLPYVRDGMRKQTLKRKVFYKHTGIYGYKSPVLKKIVKLKASPLEELEVLEQLRWVENGYRITVKETPFETQAIDTPEDLKRITRNRKLI